MSSDQPSPFETGFSGAMGGCLGIAAFLAIVVTVLVYLFRFL